MDNSRKNYRKRMAAEARKAARRSPADWRCDECGGCKDCGSRCVCFDDTCPAATNRTLVIMNVEEL